MPFLVELRGSRDLLPLPIPLNMFLPNQVLTDLRLAHIQRMALRLLLMLMLVLVLLMLQTLDMFH